MTGMRISGSGMASFGLNAINERKRLREAKMAIECFHDALLAVAKGKLTPAQVGDFFWNSDLTTAKFYGSVLSFEGE